MTKDRFLFRSISLLLALSLIVAGCAGGPGRREGAQTRDLAGVGWGRGISREEMALGEKIHAEILSSFYIYTDPKVVDYVNRIGNALAAFAERRELKYRFTILYNDKIYATSAPGGFVYVTTGMMSFLENEAELAAVFAHEIGRLQDSDPRLSRARKALEAVTRGGAMVAPAFGQIGMLAALGLALVHALAESKILTPEEQLRLADGRALQYMVSAQYDPQGLIDLMYKFAEAEEVLVPYLYDYVQARPIHEARLTHIQEEFAKLPLEGRSFPTHHDTYRDMTKGIRQIYQR